jgi:hypothetical protein
MSREDAERSAREHGAGWIALEARPGEWRVIRAPGATSTRPLKATIEPPPVPPREDPAPGSRGIGFRGF